jgi:hypothetical protein
MNYITFIEKLAGCKLKWWQRCYLRVFHRPNKREMAIFKYLMNKSDIKSRR